MLRQHPAFRSLEAVRVSAVRTYDPSALRQLEQQLDTLRDAGMPAH